MNCGATKLDILRYLVFIAIALKQKIRETGTVQSLHGVTDGTTFQSSKNLDNLDLK